eukprot:CAMPEP_0185838562 /NCGR_PEP_ID=MMETSP1353-20130828/13246_1 /TAXON_ID=1077150 /ORGANISM="Erythrolobus australicus, Strain CCMP3124" /LENGTH=339 /DNA_ID=CAMNT_0028537637 /DNA_START=83 /DNA_END=1102 /DNA_ORIENTATION=-
MPLGSACLLRFLDLKRLLGSCFCRNTAEACAAAVTECTWNPDVIIAAGGSCAAAAIALRRLSPSKPKTIQLMHPRLRLSKLKDDIDILITPEHDELLPSAAKDLKHARGVCVPWIRTIGTVHDVGIRLYNAQRSEVQRQKHRQIAVLIGGPRNVFSARTYEFKVVSAVHWLVKHVTSGTNNASHLTVLSSRRTPQALQNSIRSLFATTNDRSANCVFTLTTAEDSARDPSLYLQALHESSALIVTEDSVSMISEAAAVPHATLFVLQTGQLRHSQRLSRFVETMLSNGFAFEFHEVSFSTKFGQSFSASGTPTSTTKPLEERERVLNELHELLDYPPRS